MLMWGKLLNEDKENGIILGLKNKLGNNVVIAITNRDKVLYLLSYAPEGIINFHSAEKEATKLIDIINNRNSRQ